MKWSVLCILSSVVSVLCFAQSEASLTVSFSEDFPMINPIYAVTVEEAQFFTAVHEGLVQYNPETLFPIPAIAESWKVNRNNTRYTFTLQSEAAFSNGDPIRAQDFVDSWVAQIDAGEEAYFAAFFDTIRGASAYRENKNTTIGLRALDSRTLQVDLERATPHFLKMLCHHSFTVTHASLRRQGENVAQISKIPYSGPYAVTEINQNTITLRKNEHYWNYDDVYFDTLYTSFDERDPEAVTDLYNRGLIDWILSGNVSFDTLEYREDVIIDETFSSTFLFFRSIGTWENPEIRRALALLVNWEQIRSREKFLAPSGNLVPAIPGYTQADTIHEQNQKRALEILKDLGYSSKNRLPAIRIALPLSWIELVEEPLKQAWSNVVEEVILFNTPQNTDSFSYYGSSNDYDIGVVSWIADYTDPYALLELFIEGSAINFSRFQDDDFTKAIRKSFSESDREKRYGFLAQAEEILLQSAAVMPVSRSIALNVIDIERYEGWSSNPLDIHPFAAMKLSSKASPKGITNHSLPESLLAQADIFSR